jgi:hypothetical protein
MILYKDDRPFILSNNHVLANVNRAKIGDPIYQPGPYDGGCEEDTVALLHDFIPIRCLDDQENSSCKIANTIASILNRLAAIAGSKTILSAKKSVPINIVDCAIAMMCNPEEAENKILYHGIPGIFTEIPVGERVKMCGRTTGLSSGEFVVDNATVRVNMGGGRIDIFEDQMTFDMKSQGGDSGSIIMREHDNAVVSLLFAGSDRYTIGNKIFNVLEAIDFMRGTF